MSRYLFEIAQVGNAHPGLSGRLCYQLQDLVLSKIPRAGRHHHWIMCSDLPDVVGDDGQCEPLREQ